MGQLGLELGQALALFEERFLAFLQKLFALEDGGFHGLQGAFAAGKLGLELGEGRTVPLIMGSVKASIGHLEASAGISGLCKILMCMRHEKIPPQVHFTKLNPMLTIDTIPAEIPLLKGGTPWQTESNRLIANVSSFGFGGSNAHACMEKYVATAKSAGPSERPFHVLSLSAISTAP